MGTISVSLPSDGTTADVADFNTPINTIVNEINGELDNANIASDAAIDGSKLANASITNAKLSTTTGELGGVWTDWTPTLVNISGGTLTFAKYMRIGKTVHYRFKYTMAGANISGTATFTLPVAAFSAASDSASKTPVGTAIYYDTNGGWVPGVVYLSSSTTVAVLTTHNVASTYPTLASVSGTVPFTWASGDAINVSGTYEAA